MHGCASMLAMEIFEDSRVISRHDLAAWLRAIADQLDSGGKVFFGAGGTVAVAENVHCELEIESEGSETSIEIEVTWQSAKSESVESAKDTESAESAESSAAEDAAPVAAAVVGVASGRSRRLRRVRRGRS